MRAGLSTIQQTLTPEAANVLSHSIAEAGRRNHGQTTPLHVAATLLSSPTGYLRQACSRSHPNSSHPLQCRALELCFSVALERLPAATSSPAVTEPPVSNALMAALKRAQAHQRRGCPEQQQQPLLAVKVELEQLIISILDDPSVSRVMREASFSSPAVKATIEQSLNNNIAGGHNLKLQFRPSPSPATTPVHIPINRNLYLNPRFQQQHGISSSNQQINDETTVSSSSPANLYLNSRLQQHQRNDDVKRVMDIMSKSKKKNPILVGESEPEATRKEILRRIETNEFETEEKFKNFEVILIEKEFASLSDKSLIPNKIKELDDLIESKIGSSEKCIVIDLADLRWLVEQPPTTTVVSDTGRESVAEMAKLVAKFAGKVWLIGTATCETYLRCQIYHPSMENDWDLQALPIASRSPLPALFSRMGSNGILGSSVKSSNPLQRHISENLDPARRAPCCPKCSSDYEQELAKLKMDFRKSLDEVKSNLPQWLRNAKAENGEVKMTDKSSTQVKDQELVLRQRIQELQKKWSEKCSIFHHNDSRNMRFDRVASMVVPLTGMYKPNKLLGQGQTVQLRSNQEPNQEPSQELPRSPVRTELALGPKQARETKVNDDLTIKDLLGCISSEPQTTVQEFQKGKFVNSTDVDSFKKLLKGLMRQAWWQPEAASTIATAVTQSKLTGGSRGSIWLLFAGPDRVGKTKMASVLAENVCGADPITICLGTRHAEKMDPGFRGKTVLDRVVESVRKNPFSVIVLSDVDEADTLVRGSIKRAMERGRLADSHGREISLGNVIFVLTGNWSTVNLDEHLLDEKRLQSVATVGWQLRLTVSEKRSKRRANWPSDNTKQRKKSGFDLSLNLNLTVDGDEDRTDGSRNSSDLTEQEDVFALENRQFRVTVPGELVGPSDGTVVFRPVDFSVVRREIVKTVKKAFSTVVDEKVSIEVDEATVENILGGLWFGRTGLEKWVEQVLVPSFHEVNRHVSSPAEGVVVCLESDRWSVEASGGGWLPSEITVVVDKV